MVFTRRMAALAAVVLIPLGVAATSFALADSPEPPKVPPRVELDSGSPTPTPTAPSARPEPTPSDEVVSRPPVTDSPAGDDDDDDRGRDSSDDGPGGDDGPGDDG
ncbi:small secreted hydrophilic protein [Streptomyces sp. Tu 3180]|uniref:small secreted hydrophilic protein n=1 Tax=Streptomyces sp. Tu 3180 TaxID=2682611 RepID=UPI001359FA8D|nr:small secreted hydrophilic protein [Streptomyces sp. Tu 3180]KAF3464998.1 small secreted hydrophilic protein [Streptomyces sp. Tu 3180]